MTLDGLWMGRALWDDTKAENQGLAPICQVQWPRVRALQDGPGDEAGQWSRVNPTASLLVCSVTCSGLVPEHSSGNAPGRELLLMDAMDKVTLPGNRAFMCMDIIHAVPQALRVPGGASALLPAGVNKAKHSSYL